MLLVFAQVNSLEMEMLRMISFSLFVQPEQYERYKRCLYAKGVSATATHLTASGSAPNAVLVNVSSRDRGDGVCTREDDSGHVRVCDRDAMDVV